jgi:hypothetical protein
MPGRTWSSRPSEPHRVPRADERPGHLDQAFQSVKEFADQFSGSQRSACWSSCSAASREDEAREQLEKLAAARVLRRAPRFDRPRRRRARVRGDESCPGAAARADWCFSHRRTVAVPVPESPEDATAEPPDGPARAGGCGGRRGGRSWSRRPTAAEDLVPRPGVGGDRADAAGAPRIWASTGGPADLEFEGVALEGPTDHPGEPPSRCSTTLLTPATSHRCRSRRGVSEPARRGDGLDLVEPADRRAPADRGRPPGRRRRSWRAGYWTTREPHAHHELAMRSWPPPTPPAAWRAGARAAGVRAAGEWREAAARPTGWWVWRLT